jgi:hypothetical protein
MLYIGKMEENIENTQRNFEAKAQTAKDNRDEIQVLKQLTRERKLKRF